MNIELKNIKLAKYLSEETPAYEAALYVDGKKVAIVSNDGHGGCDMEHWLDGGYNSPMAQKVHGYFKALPNLPSKYFEDGLEQSLEMWCHEKVWDADMLKTVRRGKNLTGITPAGVEYSWKIPKAQFTDKHRASILAKHPGTRFFHEMSDDEILALAHAKDKAAA